MRHSVIFRVTAENKSEEKRCWLLMHKTGSESKYIVRMDVRKVMRRRGSQGKCPRLECIRAISGRSLCTLVFGVADK